MKDFFSLLKNIIISPIKTIRTVEFTVSRKRNSIVGLWIVIYLNLILNSIKRYESAVELIFAYFTFSLILALIAYYVSVYMHLLLLKVIAKKSIKFKVLSVYLAPYVFLQSLISIVLSPVSRLSLILFYSLKIILVLWYAINLCLINREIFGVADKKNRSIFLIVVIFNVLSIIVTYINNKL